MKQAALAGIGIVLLPDILVNEELVQGQLTRILQPHVPAPTPMSLVYPRDRRGTPKMKTFIEFFMARFGHGVEAY